MAGSRTIEILTTVPFPETVMQSLRNVTPHIKLSFHPAKRTEDIPQEVWSKAEILYTDVLLPDIALVPNLKWVQFHYAGIDFVQGSSLLSNPELKITSMSGASAIQEGEFIVGMMLALGHHLPDLVHNQFKADWPSDRWERFLPVELMGSTVGLLGYGSIAREVARLLQPFNVTILATKRDVMHPADEGYTVEGHGDLEGNYFNRLYPIEALNSMIKLCDFVVVTLPLTPATRGLIGETEFKAMKPNAYLIHISRGGVVDENALLQALNEKQIAGAVIDVFTQEPLPAEHPLWKAPNLFITPHVSGFSPKYKERAGEMFVENLKRYLHDEPLMNLYVPERHY
jgi:phosphoglycerate dehydrogenase-like enzyme